MDWLSNIVYGRKRRNQSEEKETDVMFFGLGPDDSLNGSVESFKFDDEKDSITDGPSTPNRSVGTKSSSADSLIPSPISTKHSWYNAAYEPPFHHDQEDFGRVRSENYPVSLLIRLYCSRHGARAQVGDFENVLMTEMDACYRQQRLSPSNLLLIVQDVTEATFPYYEEGLTRLLSALAADKRGVLRCVLWMDSYYQAQSFSSVLSTYCNNLLELNIGAPRRLDQPLSHPPPVFEEEAARVISLLEVWLLANMKTLKCLRLYTFIDIDSELQSVVNLCPRLEYLTISKVGGISNICDFPSIRTVELDKQGLGYTDDDLRLLKRIPTMFPYAKRVRIVGSQFSPLVETLIERLGSSPKRHFYIFYPELSYDKIAKICKKTSLKIVKAERLREETTSPITITLKNERYQNSIVIHNGPFLYYTPLR